MDTCGSINSVYSKCVKLSGLQGYSCASDVDMTDDDNKMVQCPCL